MTLSVEALGLVPALAVGYALLARAERPSRLRVAAAAAALALVFAAFSTELQPLALHTFLWAHLLQNVVLAEWAPGLLVLAVPPLLGRRARAAADLPPARRAAALARHVLRVAPAVGLRLRARASALAAARRARDVSRRGRRASGGP